MSEPGIRVLHIDDAHTWRGGQHQVYLLMTELKKLGIAQALASPADSPLSLKAGELGIECYPLTAHFGELDPFAPARLARFAVKWPATLLHAHTGHAHTLGLRTARKPQPPLPLVVTRRVDFEVGKNFFSRRKYTAPGQHFIAISSAVRNVLKAGGVAAKNITVVPSGVPEIDPAKAIPREQVRAEFNIAADEIAIVSVGALTDHKGQKYFIAAAPEVFKQFPNATFHILGAGELHHELQTQINALALNQKIILHGHVPDARLKLAGFDLYVSSSHLEGLGTAVLDAMLAKLPVVAAAAGGIVDYVIDQKTGWLAAPRDARTLAHAIIQALQETSTAREAIENAARENVLQNFSPRATAEGTLAVYRLALNDK